MTDDCLLTTRQESFNALECAEPIHYLTVLLLLLLLVLFAAFSILFLCVCSPRWCVLSVALESIIRVYVWQANTMNATTDGAMRMEWNAKRLGSMGVCVAAVRSLIPFCR